METGDRADRAKLAAVQFRWGIGSVERELLPLLHLHIFIETTTGMHEAGGAAQLVE